MQDAAFSAFLTQHLRAVQQVPAHQPEAQANLHTQLARLLAELAVPPAGEALTQPVLAERLEFLQQRAEREAMPAPSLQGRLEELLLSTLLDLLGRQ